MKNKSSTKLNGKNSPRPLFCSGSIYCTPGAVTHVRPEVMKSSLGRHFAGDWGDVDAHDWLENDLAVERGGRILSAFHTETDRKFWIITEADRSATTILLPNEY
jgi:hypothetical protein